MNSSSVVAFKVRWWQETDLHGHRRPARDLDHPAVLVDLPIRFQCLPLRHRTLISTTVLSPTMPFQLAYTPATQPAGMVHERQVDVLGCLRVLGLADDLVEFDAQGVGDQRTASANTPCPARHRLQVGIVDRLPKPTGLGGR